MATCALQTAEALNLAEASLFRFFESLVRPFPDAQPRRLPHRVRSFLWIASGGFRPYIAALIGLRAAAGTLEAMLFAMLGRVVDWLAATPRGELWVLHRHELGLLGLMLLAIPCLSALQSLLKHQTLSGNLPTRMRWQLHCLMLDQGMGFFQKELSGRVADRVMSMAHAAKDCWMSLIELFAFVSVYLVTMLTISASLDMRLLLPFVAWLVAYGYLVKHAIPLMDLASCEEARTRSITLGWLVDTYSHMLTVKLFDHGNAEAERAKGVMSTHLDATRAHDRQISAFVLINQTLGYGLLLIVTCVSLALWNSGAIGVGAVATATAIALRLTSMSQWLLWETTAVFDDIGTIRAGLDTLSHCDVNERNEAAPALPLSKGEIHFDNVSFSYRDGAEVLKDFTLHVKPGEHVAIVGASGAGKSSLFGLLLQLHEPQAGHVYVDGQNIARVKGTSLRQQFGVVGQNTSLLHRSVFDNIAYGRTAAAADEVIRAARLAHAHDFIEAISDANGKSGYEASVGEGGGKLSGGQQQRLVIARAVLKDAPILLLDEATSALDLATEQAVMNSLLQHMKGKTMLTISHRLSSLTSMDRIVVLNNGRVAEEGRHEDLLARGGVYARLWEQKAGQDVDGPILS